MSHAGGVRCVCVSDHAPEPFDVQVHHIIPLYAGGPDTPDNRVPICSTTHSNVHSLIRAWEKARGEPSWEIRRRFSPYTRDLARRGFEDR